MAKPTPLKKLTLHALELIAGKGIDQANARSLMSGLETYGFPKLALGKPHRLAHFLAQVMHESGRFRYDREVWGPTAAQKRYEGRTDLGNTVAGDGAKFKGRGPMQVTGRSNYAQFTAWARKIDKKAPDFTAAPDLLNTDPWEGLSPLWYWETRKLNAKADIGDVRAVTKIVNGGYNGIADRELLYRRAALVLLGYAPGEVTRFQMEHDLTADGVAGPKTLKALHWALIQLPALSSYPGASTEVGKGLQAKPGHGIIAIIVAAIGAAIAYFTGG